MNICPCCNTTFDKADSEAFEADVYSDGQVLVYCSAECVEHLQDEHQEYLDSYEV